MLFAVIVLAASACSSEVPRANGSRSADPAKGAATGTDAAPTDSHDMPGMTDAEMAGMDDRGFSKLANGEEHGEAFPQAISKSDRVELARQLVLAREVALQYPTVADAEAAGMRRAGPFSPGLGAHYLSYASVGGDADGVMSDDDIRRPLAWIYDGTHPDSRIAGLFYMTPVEDPVGFAGPNDTWHVHSKICLVSGPDGIDTPLGADRDATVAQCEAVGGSLLSRTQYLAHVWVVPGYESPEGVFSHLTSSVTCDDGTYRTIDPTKIGTKTTICRDGTE